MDVLQEFQQHLADRGLAADPDEAAAALYLAGHDGADVLDRELGVCLSRGLPIEMGIIGSILTPLLKPLQVLMERMRDEPDVPPEDLPEPDEVDRYLEGEWLPVVSSNVAAIRYLPDDRAEEVEFHNGGFYRYENVSKRLARRFAMAPSKGKFVWDVFRLRGTKYGWNPNHPYSFISGPSRYKPKWMDTLEKRLLHGMIRPEGIVPAAMLD